MFKTILPLALLLTAAAPAMAQNAPGGVHVVTADINLATPAGIATLDRRIARAVDRACPEARGRELTSFQTVYACRAAACRSVAPQRERLLAARTGTMTVASAR